MKEIIPAHFVQESTTYTFDLNDPDLDRKLKEMFAEMQEEEHEAIFQEGA
jgi:hypothetical protein